MANKNKSCNGITEIKYSNFARKGLVKKLKNIHVKRFKRFFKKQICCTEFSDSAAHKYHWNDSAAHKHHWNDSAAHQYHWNEITRISFGRLEE